MKKIFFNTFFWLVFSFSAYGSTLLTCNKDIVISVDGKNNIYANVFNLNGVKLNAKWEFFHNPLSLSYARLFFYKNDNKKINKTVFSEKELNLFLEQTDYEFYILEQEFENYSGTERTQKLSLYSKKLDKKIDCLKYSMLNWEIISKKFECEKDKDMPSCLTDEAKKEAGKNPFDFSPAIHKHNIFIAHPIEKQDTLVDMSKDEEENQTENLFKNSPDSTDSQILFQRKEPPSTIEKMNETENFINKNLQ